jgi:hypothetical protein
VTSKSPKECKNKTIFGLNSRDPIQSASLAARPGTEIFKISPDDSDVQPGVRTLGWWFSPLAAYLKDLGFRDLGFCFVAKCQRWNPRSCTC